MKGEIIIGGFLEIILQGIFTEVVNSNPKAKKAVKGMCDNYNKQVSNVKKEYSTTKDKAHAMSDSQLKNAYQNASNNVKKSAYAQEIKTRVNSTKANEPKYKPIDGWDKRG